MMKYRSQRSSQSQPTILAADELSRSSGGLDYVPPGYLNIEAVEKDERAYKAWLSSMKTKYPGFGDLSYQDAWENGVWPKKAK